MRIANKTSDNLSWFEKMNGAHIRLEPLHLLFFLLSVSQASLCASSEKPHPPLFSFAVELTVPYCNFLSTCGNRLSNDTELNFFFL